MAINLQKGQKIDIGLVKLSVGLGWNPNEGTGYDFDLDASAFMLNENRIIPSENFFVFYGNTNSPDAALHHTGDDPTGGNSADGDDETIQVDLSKIDTSINEILFVVTIYFNNKSWKGQNTTTNVSIIQYIHKFWVVRQKLK